jgi:3-carboxy-cis,cis-muconate cycloisomerase
LPSNTAVAVDVGLLSPVSAGHDHIVSDSTFVHAMVTAEVALLRAIDAVRGEEPDEIDRHSAAWGWRGIGELVTEHGVDAGALAAAAVGSGNPVIPLVAELRHRGDIHNGATSQDILDTAVMLVAWRVRSELVAGLDVLERNLAVFAQTHRDRAAAARTLTQHAVPTTVGLRASTWLRGIRRSTERLRMLTLPAQLGGAAGTLAAFVEMVGDSAAAQLPGVFAAQLCLDAAEAPWHTTRWPVTELGDALTQVIDALGVLAADVTTLSRTEIAELSEGEGGGSSAMPQKRNPAASILIRSAAMRAPQLNATLHLSAALAVDERPDGAWHAEWPTLRELERLALGAVAHARNVVAGLVVHTDAIERNLAMTNGRIVSERITAADLGLSREAVENIIRRSDDGDLHAVLDRALADAGSHVRAVDLLDPVQYTGLAAKLVDQATDDGESKSV